MLSVSDIPGGSGAGAVSGADFSAVNCTNDEWYGEGGCYWHSLTDNNNNSVLNYYDAWKACLDRGSMLAAM